MISAVDFVNLDAAESLVGDLLAALSARRVYGAEHTRTSDAVRRFVAEFRRYRTTAENGRFAFRAEGGLIKHEGYPLESSNRLVQMATILAGRNCAGLSFGPETDEKVVVALLAELGGKDPLPGRVGCIDILGEREGHDPAQDDGDLSTMPEFRVPMRIYRNAAKSLETLMDRVRSGEAIDLGQVTDLVECVVEEVTASGTRILGPVQFTQWDSFTFQHSVNVFLIATALLEQFANSRDELLAMAQAALLHDIGKSRVPTAILHKSGKLTKEEYATIQLHPALGAQILLELGSADPLAIEVAYCHHMHDDGVGYPHSNLPITPGPVTRILQVADMFEALTATRPYKSGMPVKEAVDVLQRMPGMGSKKPALDLLLARLTDCPPGSDVVLSSGERARVVRTHADTPSRPVVRLLTNAVGETIESFDLVDLREEANVSIAQVVLRPTKSPVASLV